MERHDRGEGRVAGFPDFSEQGVCGLGSEYGRNRVMGTTRCVGGGRGEWERLEQNTVWTAAVHGCLQVFNLGSRWQAAGYIECYINQDAGTPMQDLI